MKSFDKSFSTFLVLLVSLLFNFTGHYLTSVNTICSIRACSYMIMRLVYFTCEYSPVMSELVQIVLSKGRQIDVGIDVVQHLEN